MAAAGPGPEGILETCLYAENLDDAAGFYETVIGLRPFARVAGRHVFFRSGSGVFLLFNPVVTTVPGGPVPPHGTKGAGHVAFAVPETAPWRDRLVALGIEIEAEIDWREGGQSLYVRDPAGNSVELATRSVWGRPDRPDISIQTSIGEHTDANA